MNLESKNIYKKRGRIFGYIVFYFIFTTVLFFILSFTHKLPEKFNYLHIMIITLFILLLGKFIDLILK